MHDLTRRFTTVLLLALPLSLSSSVALAQTGIIYAGNAAAFEGSAGCSTCLQGFTDLQTEWTNAGLATTITSAFPPSSTGIRVFLATSPTINFTAAQTQVLQEILRAGGCVILSHDSTDVAAQNDLLQQLGSTMQFGALRLVGTTSGTVIGAADPLMAGTANGDPLCTFSPGQLAGTTSQLVQCCPGDQQVIIGTDDAAVAPGRIIGVADFDILNNVPRLFFPPTCGQPAVAAFRASIPAACSGPVVVDRPPVIECVGPILCTDPDECTANSACSPTVAVCIDDVDGVLDPICLPGPGYNTGSSAVNVSCTDSGGNTTTAQCNVTVNDCQEPACTAPAPLSLQCSTGCGVPSGDPAVLAWVAQFGATDNCPGAGGTAALPDLFATGCQVGFQTPVPFRATDAAGHDRACLGSVSVRDTVGPAVNVPMDMTIECTEPGGVPATDPRVRAWLLSASATDICHPASATSNAPALFPAACAPGQATPVTFTGSDTCNNTSTANASVTVVDTTAPVLGGCALADPAPPVPPASPSSNHFVVECGTATDSCDSQPIDLMAQFLVTSHIVDQGSCVQQQTVIDVDCGEMVEIHLLAPPCPASPPASPAPPLEVNSLGIRVIRGESVELEVVAADACNNVSAACVVDAASRCLPIEGEGHGCPVAPCLTGPVQNLAPLAAPVHPQLDPYRLRN